MYFVDNYPPKPNILVTGSAGFLGKTFCSLASKQYHTYRVDPKLGVDAQSIQEIHAERLFKPLDCIVHLGASHLMQKSVEDPESFYDNNLNGMTAVLKIAKVYACPIVFASSAAVYNPTTAYGQTKLWGEEMLKEFSLRHGIPHVSLRFFNIAGPGYTARPATHAIPALLRSILTRQVFTINGNDFNTPDGTAIRDYVHVKDCAGVIMKSIEYLKLPGFKSATMDVGTGEGTSMIELVNKVSTHIGRTILPEFGPRRPGDPDKLVAATTNDLGWKSTYSIYGIIGAAWEDELNTLRKSYA